jgi:hypothetical protein
LLLLGLLAWALGALVYDVAGGWRWLAVAALLSLTGAALVTARGAWRRLALGFAPPLLVLCWWLTQTPRNQRDWQPDVARTASAQIDGDLVTLSNVRNFEYRSETDFTPRWETRQVRLSQLTGVDIAVTYWGSPWMAHPVVSFQFADAPPVCFSIETRKENGEAYSAIGGIYRQYELIYIVADERDVVRLRSNIREGEEVFLYRTAIPVEKARQRFLEYLAALNSLQQNPRWYNAVTTNCTTSIRAQHPADERLPWDWRILVNGKADECMFERSAWVTGGLPFTEFKRRSLINPQARREAANEDFSRAIREGRPFGERSVGPRP